MNLFEIIQQRKRIKSQLMINIANHQNPCMIESQYGTCHQRPSIDQHITKNKLTLTKLKQTKLKQKKRLWN